MTYIFMAVHYPEPGRRDDLYQRMTGMATTLAGTSTSPTRHEAVTHFSL
jgi:hypothetical protein